MIRDANIDWFRKRVYYDYWVLHGLIIAAVDEAGTAAFTEGELLQNPTASSKVAPNVFLGEVGALGIVGAQFAAAGDLLLGSFRCPVDLDPKFPIGFKINWSNAGGASSGRGITFILLQEVKKKGVALATPTTALDTILVESLCTAADANEWTARGIRKKIGLTRQDISDGAHITFSLEMDIIDAGASACKIFGIELDYVPQLCVGAGSNTDRPYRSDGIS